MRKFVLFAFLVINCLVAQTAKWDSLASMNTRRWYHAAVELDNGEILVTGGSDITGYITNSCEIYNSSTNVWRFTDTMNVKRFKHKLLLLDDGRVLAIGGKNEPSCEIYDPATEKWTLTDSLLLIRKEDPKSVKLPNGNILITGGHRRTGVGKEEIYKSCEVFDVQSEKWIKVADMNYARKNHTITLLNDNRILVTGGLTENSDYFKMETKSCEIYDPSIDNWEIIDSLKTFHFNHNALLLRNGNVLISNGQTRDGSTFMCEIYDPVNDKWDYSGELDSFHSYHSSFQLNDSTVLIVGGDNENWEIFNLNKQQSAYVGYSDIFWSHQSVLKLANNDIVKIGGVIWQDAVVFPTDKCELFNFIPTGIKNKENKPLNNYQLFQNYPNPFNPSTTVRFGLPEDGAVYLLVFDMQGRLVKTLVDGFKAAGVYNEIWNGTDNEGKPVASGVYVYQLKTKQMTLSKKMLLIR